MLLKKNEILTVQSGKKIKVLDILGDGGQGEVYLVEMENKLFALKIYKDDINVDNIRLICNCQVGSCLGRNNASNGGRAREGYNNSNNNCNCNCNKCN